MKIRDEKTWKFAKAVCLELGDKEVARLLRMSPRSINTYKSYGFPFASVCVLKVRRPNLCAWSFLPKDYFDDSSSEAGAL